MGCGDDGPAANGGSTGAASTSSTAETTAREPSMDSTAAGSSEGSSGAVATGSTGDSTGSTGDSGEGSTGEEVCEAPGALVSCDSLADQPSPLQAIGLDCPGDANEAIPLLAGQFLSTDPDAWRLATQYGTYIDGRSGLPLWGPTEGDQLLMISTGWIGQPDAMGRVTMDGLDLDANDNPDDKPLPAPMDPTPGSGGIPFMDCDGVGDCSDSLGAQWNGGGGVAQDLLWFQFRTEVPGGTHGFSLDFAFFSEEFPEYVDTTFNDMFVVWSSSETYVGNLCFVNEEPCTVTALWPVDYPEFAPELDGTGFSLDGFDDGGGTGWFQIKGSAQPHEELELTMALFDMGDDVLDTLVLLDGFAWDCQGCTPTPENPCGVVEPGRG